MNKGSRRYAGIAMQIARQDAGVIISGVFDLARIPNMDWAHLPMFPATIAQALSDHNKAAHDALNIDADTVDGVDLPASIAEVLTDHDLVRHPLAIIPAMDDAHIPDLETLSYGAAFATAQIPNLNASKITAGIFQQARIPWSLIPASGIVIGADTNLFRLMANYLATSDNFQVALDLLVGGHAEITGNLTQNGIRILDPAEKTIAGGAVTIDSTTVILVSQSGVADDLDTVNPVVGMDGAEIYLKAKTGHTINLKDTGNFSLTGYTPRLSSTQHTVRLQYDGASAKWVVVGGYFALW